MRSYKGYLILVILIFAIIGLTFELLSNPVGLLTKILVGIGILTIAVFIYRFIMTKRAGGSFSSSNQYQQSRPTRAQIAKAKRTSQGKMKNPSPPFLHKGKDGKPKPARAINRKNTQHLTVIEGKKNKKKSRALF